MTAPAPIDHPARTTSATDVTSSAKPHRGRRISWADLYRERPDLRPDNDDGKLEEAA